MEEIDRETVLEEAFKIFKKRIETRFLKPIDAILDINTNAGEGFAAMSLQCILIEFLEAFYQGKIYCQPKNEDQINRLADDLKILPEEVREHTQPNEYRSSSRLFKEFLTGHQPFKEKFSGSLADKFYREIRCGLIHEAATKKNSVIRASKKSFFVERENGQLIIYRSGFQEAIRNYLKNYRLELQQSEERRIAFVRKMDDLCQMPRLYYFAYGSNLSQEQFKKRVGNIYDVFSGCHIKNYKFLFDKISTKDCGTSKANLLKDASSIVHGVCYELDNEGFDKLEKCEGGYEVIDVAVFKDKKLFIIAKTFISDKRDSNLKPEESYLNCVLNGAEKMKLPKDYIEQIKQSALH